MLRFIAYILVFFILFRLVGAVLRLFFGSNQRRSNSTKSKNDNINVNKPPKSKKSEGYKGGEYVDYEELE